MMIASQQQVSVAEASCLSSSKGERRDNSATFATLEAWQSVDSDEGVTLGAGRFKEIEFPLPPLAEQHQIVAEVEARTTAINHLEAELDRQITRSNRFRQSVYPQPSQVS